MSRRLCNQNFRTQYCWCKNKEYFIETYINNQHNLVNVPIYCNNKHELVLANGKIRKPYFRHNNPEDTGGNPMTAWHAEWQGHFLRTEVPYNRKNSNQIKSRIADVDLVETNRILELQHSPITKEEVDERKNDYTTVYNKQVVWVIHGNGAVNVKNFEQSGRVYLEFNSDLWKYESFIEYDFIYIDIDSKIYKVNPKKVKSHMIDVESGKDKVDFINSLKTGVELWMDKEPEQCNLFIRQQGAGNGKTFGIIQMLESDEVAHYNTFIFVTKQHAAKSVMKAELENQVENGHLKYINEITIEDKQNKFIIEFANEKTGKVAKVIIATIDSLMYSIGDTNHNFYDKFQGIIDSIIDNHINADKAGVIRYAGVNPKLNKETLLFIDEAQDLTINYGQAVLNIMRNKYLDAYIVGDKLQSISHEENAFTYLYDNYFPSINAIKLSPTNICRRFIHPKLVNFVNGVIPFKKYNLPPVTPYKEYDGSDENPLVFFEGEQLFQGADEDKFNQELDEIMIHFRSEVETNNRMPNDFLFVTPFTTNNPLVDALQGRIDTFWKERIASDSDEYFRYAIFHKSEEGASINLEESNNSTRIVSIHSSKGDGRNVVFIIGFSENALKRFSSRSDTLIYNSLFHVAITRMKHKMYIQYFNNGDKFAQKLGRFCFNQAEYTTIRPNLHIYNSIKYSDVVGGCSKINFENFSAKFIEPANLDKLEDDKGERKIIDSGNHIIRYSSLLITLLIEIINKEGSKQDELKRQIKKLLYMIDDSNITSVNNWNDYNSIITHRQIAVMKIADRGRDYVNYHKIIIDNMRNIKIKLSKKVLDSDALPTFCPFECVILHHMLEIKTSGIYTDTSISDIYAIVDVYNDSYQNETIGHENCLCNKYFRGSAHNKTNTSIDKMKAYLLQHFDKVKYIENSIRSFHVDYPHLNWLYNHVVKFNGYNKNYKIWRHFQLIGYDESQVVIAYIKPQFNKLNYNEVLMSSLYDASMIANVEQFTEKVDVQIKSENYNRFYGKKIVSCVFTLDRKEPYYISWYDEGINLIDLNKNLLRETIYNFMKSHFSSENNGIYYFYKYWRCNCPEDQKSSSNFVAFLLDKYNDIKNKGETDKKKFPSYIDEFLNLIKLKVDMCDDKKEKKKILAEFDNKEAFMLALDKRLDESIKRYLDMRDDESDDDSD